MSRQGFLVVLSGPSSVGKDTLLEAVLGHIPDMVYSVSATTRPPRPGERHGVDYYFLSDEEFRELIRNDGLLEWAEYCDYLYGTPRAFVEEMVAQGKIVISDIDIQGAEQLRRTMPDGVFIFLMPPSLEELRRRIMRRATDSPEAIASRMARAEEEMHSIVNYDYWILNADLAQAVEDLKAIIRAESLRVKRGGYKEVGESL
ncbi:MAG: guanylate kinase [Firmicutes bacterium]|jgi:guanylate kinase|nr:guanylate kinase [Bacillota bacterium]